MVPKQIIELNPPPGVVTEYTDRTAGVRWVDSNLVRFRKGKPEKFGGWVRESTNTFDGKGRTMVGWSALDGTPYLAFGTDKKLYISDGGVHYDVTPLRDSGTLGANPFTTVNGSATIKVAHTNHGELVNDIVIFDGAATFNGVTIDGEYTVTAVNNTNEYEIEHTSTATASGQGGGAAVDYEYLIHTGGETAVVGLGWGAGSWSSPRASSQGWNVPAASTDLFLDPQLWTMDLWGEDLVACDRHNGGIYLWDASNGTATRASAISGAPKANSIVVSEDRHLVAFGSNEGSGDRDPMLVHWSDQEDYTVWTAASTNSAGSHRLSNGSTILAAARARGEILIWTDSAIYNMQPTGPTAFFLFNELGHGCGIPGPNGWVSYAGNIYWMGRSCTQFYAYDGTVRVIECPILNWIQDNIDLDQLYLVSSGTNLQHGEVIWLFPSNEGGGEVDKYIIFNLLENVWYYGSLSRTAWIDRALGLRSHPTALGNDGYLYTHESGTQDHDQAMEPFITLGAIELGEGDVIMFVDRLLTDFEIDGGEVDVTFTSQAYSASTNIVTKGPYAVSATRQKVDTRVRGRQVSIKLSSDGIADQWRLGSMRLRVKPVARRFA